MSELNDDGDIILGPGDALEGLQIAFENYALWIGTYRHKGEDVWGYLIVNNHTGIVEAEGASYPNSMVAMCFLEKRYKKVMADPEAEMERQSKAMGVFPADLGSLFPDFNDKDGQGGLDS